LHMPVIMQSCSPPLSRDQAIGRTAGQGDGAETADRAEPAGRGGVTKEGRAAGDVTPSPELVGVARFLYTDDQKFGRR
jgi:hypothetical protein